MEGRGAAGISPRQLRRLFDQYIGIPPKAFARVVRFQHLLASMMRTPASLWARLRFDLGYYDQAHLIKEFKTFYGLPPSAALRRE